MTIDHGMNVREVRALAASLTHAADRLDQIRHQLQAVVRAAAWSGNQATRFKADTWRSHRARLGKASDELRTYAAIARRNADEQEKASAVSAGPRGARSGTGRRLLDLSMISLVLRIADRFNIAIDWAKNGEAILKAKGLGSLLKLPTKLRIGPLAAAQISIDAYHFRAALDGGTTDDKIRRGLDLGWTLLGTAFPKVALAKLVWDGTWEGGTAAYQAANQKWDFEGAFVASVIQYQYGGDPSNGPDLAHRYAGPRGYLTYLQDGFSNAFRKWW